jgi:GMP reductase
MTGVGYPQLSAIVECADAAHGLEGHICADGGCATPGDIAKAFGGGADFVMLGGMLAGHAECVGDVVERDGTKFQRFYGMSSRSAMEKYSGGVAQYRAAEGKEVLVPYRGSGRGHGAGNPRRRALGVHLCRRAAACASSPSARHSCASRSN